MGDPYPYCEPCREKYNIPLCNRYKHCDFCCDKDSRYWKRIKKAHNNRARRKRQNNTLKRDVEFEKDGEGAEKQHGNRSKVNVTIVKLLAIPIHFVKPVVKTVIYGFVQSMNHANFVAIKTRSTGSV